MDIKLTIPAQPAREITIPECPAPGEREALCQAMATARPGDVVTCPPGTLLSHWNGPNFSWNTMPVRMHF
jgi:hypothetical protein